MSRAYELGVRMERTRLHPESLREEVVVGQDVGCPPDLTSVDPIAALRPLLPPSAG
jgi:hypothetical protein